MASSLYSNSQHVDFESVLGMDDPGMVSMFEALMASGLRGFLGCPAIVYEDALVDFFENASVRNGVVISTVGGQLVEISEKLFAETFELPVDGLGDLSEMPKDAIFYAWSIVSLSGEPINLSGRKNQMKMPFRLLCDIVAKAISVKAGSFNAITVEKFSLMTAVVCGVKMNWAKFLFGVLKKMVSAGSKQAKGFAIQISLLLATFPTVELGESSEFPASKILSKKTVLRFVSINVRDGAEEAAGAAKKKAVSKKRPAADVGAAVPKKKRSLKKISISSLELVEVAEEAIPIQQVVEPLDVEEPRCSSADAVDLIIQQVLDETRASDAPADITQPAVTEEKNWFDLPYDDLVKQWEAERPVVTASDTEDEIATEDVAPAVGVLQVEEFEAPISAVETLSADEQMSLDDILLTIPVDIPLPSTCMEVTKIKMGQMIKIPGVTEKTWFLNSLPRIPADDKGKEILVEKDPVKGNPAAEHYSLICADIDLLVDLRAKVIDEVATFFHYFSLRKLASINIEEMYRKEEQVLHWGETESPQVAIQRKNQQMEKRICISADEFFQAFFQSKFLTTTMNSKQMNDLKKGLMALVGTIFQDLFDIKKTQRAQEAKLNALDGQVAALRNEQLEFQNRISADILSLSTQFADIVEFIRGGDAKKGEGGSSSRPTPVRVERRPMPTPQSPRDVAGSSSAVRIPTFPRTTGTLAERIEQARRHILESGQFISVEEAAKRIRQADFQESDRLQRERERARREKRSSSSRRRRGF
ncbi:dystroglycan-like [Dorcoceras hygrometricum]|uniref:Dystroglycan-like n=1 Tax=Dorcoceras hygrometricum TaxID=472368 RepID=A0A2Z7B8S7_9LAMI|nr:dystroglycan-like [Dorcoceras hygrometricum]